MAQTYHIVGNRFEGDIAVTDSLDKAGLIVDALMRARLDPEWSDYWVRDDAGSEYYHDAARATVFSASCFAVQA